MQILLKPENFHAKSHAENHTEIHRQSHNYDNIRAAELALLAGKLPPSSSPSSPPSPPALPPSPPPTRTDFESRLSAAYTSDPFPTEVLELLCTGARHCKTISLAECSEIACCLRYRSNLYIPASDSLRLHMLRQAHNAPVAGHSRRSKTLQLIAREYFRPGIRKDVECYVRN